MAFGEATAVLDGRTGLVPLRSRTVQYTTDPKPTSDPNGHPHGPAPRPLEFQHRPRAGRHRQRNRPRQPLEVPLHHLGERWRCLRARVPALHRGGGSAHHDGRAADRAAQPEERGGGAEGRGGAGVGADRRLGRDRGLHPAELLHGHRGLVALLLRQDDQLDLRGLPGGDGGGRSLHRTGQQRAAAAGPLAGLQRGDDRGGLLRGQQGDRKGGAGLPADPLRNPDPDARSARWG